MTYPKRSSFDACHIVLNFHSYCLAPETLHQLNQIPLNTCTNPVLNLQLGAVIEGEYKKILSCNFFLVVIWCQIVFSWSLDI